MPSVLGVAILVKGLLVEAVLVIAVLVIAGFVIAVLGVTELVKALCHHIVGYSCMQT